MGCGVYWQQIHEVEGKIAVLEEAGISPTHPGYIEFERQRGALMAQVGTKFPRTFFQVAKSFGMSPGVITLWEDVESGWMTEARAKPGAPPVYHYVSDQTAMKVLKGELSHEEFTQLLVPDPYIGE